MATVKYTDLLPEVLPNLAADPSEPVTVAAIKRACIQFCRESWVWKALPDPADLVAGETTYDLEARSGADVSAVINVTANGVPLKNRNSPWLDTELPGWRTTRATPKYYTQVNTQQVIIAPVPDLNVTGGLVMTLAMQPSQKATGLPDWLYNQYLYSLAHGALAYLMLMPGKAWTDRELGANYFKLFENAIADARADAESALGRAPVRSTYQH